MSASDRSSAGVADTLAQALSDVRPAALDPIERRLGMAGVLAAVFGETPQAQRVGSYELVSKAGEGGMGAVYKARDPRNGQWVALKLIRDSSAKLLQRFAREARVLRRLQHPGIVRYFEHGKDPNGPHYLAMEWLEGEDLSARIARHTTLSIDATLHVALSVASALHAAHRAGLIHRDIKPANVFWDASSRVRVLDFGLARNDTVGHTLTSTGNIVGTPAYMAPEQIRGRAEVVSDVYALGATLFECLTGRPPFVGATPAELLLAVLNTPAPHASSLRADVPRALDTLLARMLDANTARRPHTMQALITELHDISANLAQGHAPTAPAISLRELDLARPTPTPEPDDGALYGLHAPLLGRARELGALTGVFQESAEERLLQTALVSGARGLGKTRVLDAFLEQSKARAPQLCSRWARAPHEGGPFAVLRQWLDPQGAPEERDVLELLDAFEARDPDAAAYNDPRKHADMLSVAFHAMLKVWSQDDRPAVLIVDDAHRADPCSLRYIRRVCVAMARCPALVLFTAEALDAQAPWHRDLFADHDEEALVHIALRPLRPWTLEAMVRACDPTLDADGVTEVCTHAEGNPMRAMRAIAHHQAGLALGADAQWQTRVDALDPSTRRVLRAAAVVGAEFDAAAVAYILQLGHEQLEARWDSLTKLGLILPVRGRRVFAFASDQAHATVDARTTPQERSDAHLRVAQWMETHRRGSAARRADHWCQGGALSRAADLYTRAAQTAMLAEQREDVERCIARGLECAQTPRQEADLLSLRAEHLHWLGRLEDASRSATRALAGLPLGSVAWFRVWSLYITSEGQRGRNDAFTDALEQVLRAPPRTPAAEAQQIVCIARATTQLAVLRPAQAAEYAAQLNDAAERAAALDDAALAWLARARSLIALNALEYSATTHQMERAFQHHLLSHDPRAAALAQIFLGAAHIILGAWEKAEAVLGDAFASAQALDSSYLQQWCRYNQGKLWASWGPFSRAQTSLEAIMHATDCSPRLRAGAGVYLSFAALRAGEVSVACSAAERAQQLHPVEAVQVLAKAAQSRAVAARGEQAEALALSAQARDGLNALGTITELEMLVHVSYIECRRDSHPEQARAQCDHAMARLRQQADSITDSQRRARFLARPHLNQRLQALSRAFAPPSTSSGDGSP